MNTRVLAVVTILASLLAGGVAGYWIGTDGGSDAPNDGIGLDGNDGAYHASLTSTHAEVEASTINLVSADAAVSAQIVAAAGTADAVTIPLLFEQASQIADAPTRIEAMYSLYKRYAELAPAPAFAHALANGMALDSPWTDSWLNVIAYRWAQADPEAALEAFRARPFIGRRAAAAVLSALPASARSDVARQMNWNPNAAEATADVIANIADNPERAFHTLEGATYPSSPTAKLAAASTWAMRDPVAAFSRFIEVSDKELSPVQISSLMSEWATREPQAALEWLSLQAESEQKGRLIGSALAGWATTAPESAIVAALELSDESQRTSAVGAVLANWTKQDPNGAINWFDTLSPDERFRAVRGIAYNYVQVSPQSAFNWATTLSPDEQAMVIPNMISRIGLENSGAAIQLAESIGDEKLRRAAILPAMLAWARQEPEAALSYALTWDDQDFQGRLVGQVLRGIQFRGSSAQIEGILAQLEGKPYFDSVAADAIRSVRNIDDALVLLGKIAEPEAHQKAAKSVYVRLRISDPPRAEAFRIQQGLPPAD